MGSYLPEVGRGCALNEMNHVLWLGISFFCRGFLYCLYNYICQDYALIKNFISDGSHASI